VVRFGPAVPVQDLVERKKKDSEGTKPTKLYREAAERIRSKVALLAAAP
jgi:hypothetical protein